MKPDSTPLAAQIADVLWTQWDPIGVNHGVPYDSPDQEAWTDEYDSYAPALAKLLLSNADEHKIADRLGQLAKNSMGLTPNPEHDRQVARALLELSSKDG